MHDKKDPVTENICTEEGLQGKKIVFAEGNQVVTEYYIEDPRPMPLKKRVVETKKEIVAERKIETVRDGEVIEVEIESLEPQVKTQLVEHIKAIGTNRDASPEYVTKNEMRSMVDEIKQAMQYNNNIYEEPIPVSAMQAEVEERVNGKKKISAFDTLLMVSIAGVVAGAVYVFFVM